MSVHMNKITIVHCADMSVHVYKITIVHCADMSGHVYKIVFRRDEINFVLKKNIDADGGRGGGNSPRVIFQCQL